MLKVDNSLVVNALDTYCESLINLKKWIKTNSGVLEQNPDKIHDSFLSSRQKENT